VGPCREATTLWVAKEELEVLYAVHGARFGNHVHRGEGWWLLGTVLELLMIAALVVLAVVVAQRLIGDGSRRGAATPATPAEGSPTRPDEAVTQLRLRYARGELSREDYLRMTADLGAPVTPADGGPAA